MQQEILIEADLINIIKGHLADGRILQSRIHLLNHYFGQDPTRKVFLKRDDELSSGITGSKYRKYSSIIKSLKDDGIEEAILIGSQNSNNIPGLLQMLNENQINAEVFLLKSNDDLRTGNFIYTSMLCPLEKMKFFDRTEWQDIETIAQTHADKKKALGKRCVVIPEGGAIPEAIPGAMTLLIDILQNQREAGIKYNHIFMDSGTGTTASGIIMGAGLLGLPCTIHICLMAESEKEFRERYFILATGFEKKSGIRITKELNGVNFYKPVTARSFGKVNSNIIQETIRIARQEGILMEPVYSVKLMMTAKHVIQTENMKGNILVVNSGGALGLTGFLEQVKIARNS